MGTNGTDIVTDARLAEESLRHLAAGSLDRPPVRKRALDYLALDGGPSPEADAEEFALRPLVDRIAYGIARGLIVAVKELEHHIASETRKVGDSVDRRFETLQPTLEELSKFVVEQRSTNATVQERLQELRADLRETETRQTAGLAELRTETRGSSTSLSQRIDASNAAQKAEVETLRGEAKAVAESLTERIESTAAALHEADARQAAGLAELQQETRSFSQSATERIDTICKELGIHQEDIAALKSTLCTFSSRVDTLVERLDRQADAVRSMAAAYSQRENELGQLVEGLARLRAYPTPGPARSW